MFLSAQFTRILVTSISDHSHLLCFGSHHRVISVIVNWILSGRNSMGRHAAGAQILHSSCEVAGSSPWGQAEVKPLQYRPNGAAGSLAPAVLIYRSTLVCLPANIDVAPLLANCMLITMTSISCICSFFLFVCLSQNQAVAAANQHKAFSLFSA